jgi:ribosomal protein L37AE/L43A
MQFESTSKDLKAHLSRNAEHRTLEMNGSYVCPVCRHATLEAIVLMDAYSCHFCRHIFTANLIEQTVRVEDSSQPTTWRWMGTQWQATNKVDVDLTIAVWVLGVVISILPPTLIWLSSHTFPPLEDSGWSWFPAVWIALSFSIHFLMVAWLLVEHYQLPVYVAFKVRLGNLFGIR